MRQEGHIVVKQKSKAELLKDIQVERRQLEKTLAVLSKEDLIQPGMIGEWSVKDVLSHLAAWEQLFLIWYESGLQGRIPDPNPVGMSTKAIDALNRQIFNQYRQHSLEDVLAKFQSSYEQIYGAILLIPEEEMFTVEGYAWTGKLTLADYIAGNTCNHYHWAKTKIRTWLKTRQRL
jgi:hypothetical protein